MHGKSLCEPEDVKKDTITNKSKRRRPTLSTFDLNKNTECKSSARNNTEIKMQNRAWRLDTKRCEAEHANVQNQVHEKTDRAKPERPSLNHHLPVVPVWNARNHNESTGFFQPID